MKLEVLVYNLNHQQFCLPLEKGSSVDSITRDVLQLPYIHLALNQFYNFESFFPNKSLEHTVRSLCVHFPFKLKLLVVLLVVFLLQCAIF